MGCASSSSTKDQERSADTRPHNEESHIKVKDNSSKVKDEARNPANQDGDKDHHEEGEEEKGFSYFQNVALYAHNHYREEHGCPPLKLNKNLCEIAERLANRMAKSEQLDKSPSDTRLHQGEVCGENLYWRETTGLPVIGDDVVKFWYNEGEAYDYDKPVLMDSTIHFTQLIWSGSREIGIASATTEKGASAVAVYFPAGNVDGEFEANVKPKIKKS